MSSTACRQCPLRKRAIFMPMSREELQFTQQFKTGELVVVGELDEDRTLLEKAARKLLAN